MPHFQSRLSCLSAGGLLIWTAFCLVPSCALAQDSVVSYPLIPHHLERARRSLRNQQMPRRSLRKEKHLRRRTMAMAQPQQVGALFQGYGTHYVDLWVGSPPQRQTVIVDTGSGITAFPCSNCKDCGAGEHHIDDIFDEFASETYQVTTCEKNTDCVSYHSSCKTGNCRITQSYSEGSRWDAIESIDSCYIAGPHERPLVKKKSSEAIDPKLASNFAINATFGCQYEITGLFKTQLADGILGMDNGKEPYWRQLFDSGHLSPMKAFSLCYSRQPTTERDGTVAGALTFGGCLTDLHNHDMVFTGSASEGRERMWSVTIRKLYLRDGSAGESVTATNRRAKKVEIDLDGVLEGIVDSGTTDTYLPKLIADDFKAAYLQLTGSEYFVDKPFQITEAQVQLLPTVILQMASTSDNNPEMDSANTPGLAGNLDTDNPFDVVIAIPPSHYMEYNEEDKTYTARLHVDKAGVAFTIGANAMMGHDVLFDSLHDRIGWAESACNYTNLVVESGYSFKITGEMKEPADEDEDEDVDCGVNTTDIEVNGCINATDIDVDTNATDVEIGVETNATDIEVGEGIDATDIDVEDNATDVDIGVETNATDIDVGEGISATDVDVEDNATDVDTGVETNATDIDVGEGITATDVDVEDNATDVDTGVETNATDIDVGEGITAIDVEGNATDVDIGVDTSATNIDIGIDPTETGVDINSTDIGVGIDASATDIDLDINTADTGVYVNATDIDAGINVTDIGIDANATAIDIGIDANATDIDVDTNATNIGFGMNTNTIDTNTNDTDVDANASDIGNIGLHTNATRIGENTNDMNANAPYHNKDTDATDTYLGLDTNAADIDVNGGVGATEVGLEGANVTEVAEGSNINGTVMGSDGANVDVNVNVDTNVDVNGGVGATEVGLDGANATEGDVGSNLDGTVMGYEGANVDTNVNQPVQNDADVFGDAGTHIDVNGGTDANADQNSGQGGTSGTWSNATNTHVKIDPNVDLEDEFEVLKEEEDVDEEEDVGFVAVDCHEENIDRQSNITMDRMKNETAAAYCKAKNNVKRFVDLCDSRECQITVLVGLGVAIIVGMCACVCLKCFFYYLFCCCCCKKKDKGPKYQGLETDEFNLMPSYSDDPAAERRPAPSGKKKYRDNVDSKDQKGRTSLSHKKTGFFS